MKTTYIIILLLLSSTFTAFGAEYNFANISWGISKEELKKTLVEKGFTGVKDDDGNVTFTGRIGGYHFRGFGVYSDGTELFNINLVFTSDKDKFFKNWMLCELAYNNLKDALIKKYGPGDVLEVFADSYSSGDGREFYAITNDQAFWFTSWPKSLTGDSKYSLQLRIVAVDFNGQHEGMIALGYNSPSFIRKEAKDKEDSWDNL